MTALLLAAGLGVIAGGGLAVGALGLNGALGGLLGLLVLAPFLADPLPSALSIAVRVVGALLTVELLWITLHRSPGLRRPSPLGLPAVLLAGFAAAIAGLALPAAVSGPPIVLGELLVGVDAGVIARAAALGLAVIALPVVLGRGSLGSIAIGAAVLLTAAELLLVGLMGPRTPLDHLLLAVTQASLAAGALVVASAAPVGPPLAGRTAVDGASPVDPAAPPLAGRRRIPVWPGVRSASTWVRRRPPAP